VVGDVLKWGVDDEVIWRVGRGDGLQRSGGVVSDVAKDFDSGAIGRCGLLRIWSGRGALLFFFAEEM
jgi:hypothetical protein